MKSPIAGSGAPRPVGPYSQAQMVTLPGGGRMVFTAGQVGLDPASGEMAGATTAEQTEQVLKNVAAVLAGAGLGMALCFAFGVANAGHMLAFSTAADVVEPNQIGTSAAIVNGLMFILGGVLIARPGVLGSRAIERGIEPGTLELAQAAGRPLLIALALAVAIAMFMKETYPRSQHGA